MPETASQMAETPWANGGRTNGTRWSVIEKEGMKEERMEAISVMAPREGRSATLALEAT